MKQKFSLIATMLFIAALFIVPSSQAQTQSPFHHLHFPESLSVSPFHHLHFPEVKRSIVLGEEAAPTTYTAYRFTAAAASFDVINNKVLTGIGYGYNKMHIKTDSSGNKYWYTDLTINFNVYAAGNTAPTYHDGQTNVIGMGPSVGICNKLINVGYVYYPPMNGSKAKSGLDVGVSISLN